MRIYEFICFPDSLNASPPSKRLSITTEQKLAAHYGSSAMDRLADCGALKAARNCSAPLSESRGISAFSHAFS